MCLLLFSSLQFCIVLEYMHRNVWKYLFTIFHGHSFAFVNRKVFQIKKKKKVVQVIVYKIKRYRIVRESSYYTNIFFCFLQVSVQRQLMYLLTKR